MYTIKYFTEKINAVATDREKRQRGHAGTVYYTAQFLSAYCRYLQDVMLHFQIVAIKVNISRQGNTLAVDYISGNSSMPIDGWYEQVLLPVIETIAAANGNRITYNYITQKHAA